MGIKKNIIYSGLLTSANYLFQFITFPYVSRILGPDGMGIFNFTQSYIQYFLMFCSLGIINLGIREISKCHTRSERDVCFSRIFQLNLYITAIVTVIYLGLMLLIPKLYHYHEYFWIGLVQIIFNAFAIEWLFKGLEDFRYITIRTLAIRAIYVVCVFVFVRHSDDVLCYFTLTVACPIVNSIVNWIYGRDFVTVKFGKLRDAAAQYLKPMFLLGSQALIAFFYVGFNTLFLGFVSTEAEVGYYTIGTKIILIILMLFSSATSVMLPRMSNLISTNETAEARRLLANSFDILFGLSIPMALGIAIYARQILLIVAGDGFEPAIPIIALSAPLIIILGISQIIQVQILMPLKMDTAVSKSCVWGAILSIILNFTLVPHLLALGSMLVWLLAEFTVMIRALLYAQKQIGTVFPIRKLFLLLAYYLPACLLCIGLNVFLHENYVSFTVGVLFIAAYSHIGQYTIFHQPLYREMLLKYRAKLPFGNGR